MLQKQKVSTRHSYRSISSVCTGLTCRLQRKTTIKVSPTRSVVNQILLSDQSDIRSHISSSYTSKFNFSPTVAIKLELYLNNFLVLVVPLHGGMASNDWLFAVLEAKGIPKRTNANIYHQSVLNTDPSVYVSLGIVSAGDVVPHDGRCTRRPFGMLIGYDQYVSETAEKFKAENGVIAWNTALIVRKGRHSKISFNTRKT